MPRGDKRLRAPDGTMNRIAGRLRERRRALKLDQEDLCARLFEATDGHWIAHRHEVVAIETAARMVTTEELIALANALNCSACWLLLGEGEVHTPGSLI